MALLPRFFHDERKRQQKIARVVLESGGEVKVTARASTGGDKRQLRGIPVLGAAGGTMQGTQPEQAVLRDN